MSTQITTSVHLLRRPWAALAMAAALGLSACGKSDAPPAQAAPAAAAATPTPAPAAAPEPAAAAPAVADPSQKLDTYIACYNRLDEMAQRSLSRYASWVKNMDTGPTGNERVVYGLYAISSGEVAQCKQSMHAAAAQQPALAKLDAAATAYVDALEKLDKTVAEAEQYYSRENYKDDQFAKGKALHAPLVSEGKAFQQASEVFSRELDVENDRMLAQHLAQVEKQEGRKLTYWRMSLMASAKQLAQVLGEEEFSADAATPLLGTYESTTDEAMKYGAANKSELPPAWFTVEHAAEEYRKAAKQRLRRVRDKVAYNEGEKMMLKPGSAWMVDGSQEQFTKAYNSLIEASNRLN